MSRPVTFKSIENHRQGDQEVSVEIYGRDKICMIEIMIPMLLQYKLQPHPNDGFRFLRSLKSCMEYLRQVSTHVKVPKTGKTGFPPAIFFCLCRGSVKRAVVRPSIRSGTIVRVRLKFVLNYHWNQYLYYAKFASAIDSYGNFTVTLTMVPD